MPRSERSHQAKEGKDHKRLYDDPDNLQAKLIANNDFTLSVEQECPDYIFMSQQNPPQVQQPAGPERNATTPEELSVISGDNISSMNSNERTLSQIEKLDEKFAGVYEGKETRPQSLLPKSKGGKVLPETKEDDLVSMIPQVPPRTHSCAIQNDHEEATARVSPPPLSSRLPPKLVAMKQKPQRVPTMAEMTSKVYNNTT
jgi:hypothetical protein